MLIDKFISVKPFIHCVLFRAFHFAFLLAKDTHNHGNHTLIYVQTISNVAHNTHRERHTQVGERERANVRTDWTVSQNSIFFSVFLCVCVVFAASRLQIIQSGLTHIDGTEKQMKMFNN